MIAYPFTNREKVISMTPAVSKENFLSFSDISRTSLITELALKRQFDNSQIISLLENEQKNTTLLLFAIRW